MNAPSFRSQGPRERALQRDDWIAQKGEEGGLGRRGRTRVRSGVRDMWKDGESFEHVGAVAFPAARRRADQNRIALV